MASAARGAFEKVSGMRMTAFTIALVYPAAMVASCYWSLHGPSQDAPTYTYKAPKKHIKLDQSEYQALPTLIQQHRENIIKQVLNFYKATPDNDTEYIYDREAEFEDPVTYGKGYATMASMIYGIPKICTRAEVMFVKIKFVKSNQQQYIQHQA